MSEPDEEADEGDGRDIALEPGHGADDSAEIERCVDPKIRLLYDVFSYRHAASILKHSHPDEYSDVSAALLDFRLTTDD